MDFPAITGTPLSRNRGEVPEVEATPPALNLMPPGGLDMRLIFTCSARTLSVKQATS